MKKLLLAFLLAFCAASAASAAGNFTDCSDPTNIAAGVLTGEQRSVAGKRFCYQFDAATDSAQFEVDLAGALISFDPDASGSAGAARVDIFKCPYAVAAGSITNQCYSILASVLTGTGGDPSTQTASVRVGKGAYRIKVTTGPSGAEKPIVTLEGGA